MTTQAETNGAPDIEQEVIAYLGEHPDFFAAHPELLRDMRIPHDSGDAVSLIERQVGVLRAQNQELQRKLRELVQIARDNDELHKRIQRFIASLMAAGSLSGVLTTLRTQMAGDFGASRVAVRLFVDRPAGLKGGQEEFAGAGSPRQRDFDAVLGRGRPVCGPLAPAQREFLFGDADDVASVALLPLHGAAWRGLLAIGSADKERFHPGMGTDLLAHLAGVVSLALNDRIGAAGD